MGVPATAIVDAVSQGAKPGGPSASGQGQFAGVIAAIAADALGNARPLFGPVSDNVDGPADPVFVLAVPAVAQTPPDAGSGVNQFPLLPVATPPFADPGSLPPASAAGAALASTPHAGNFPASPLANLPGQPGTRLPDPLAPPPFTALGPAPPASSAETALARTLHTLIPLSSPLASPTEPIGSAALIPGTSSAQVGPAPGPTAQTTEATPPVATDRARQGPAAAHLPELPVAGTPAAAAPRSAIAVAVLGLNAAPGEPSPAQLPQAAARRPAAADSPGLSQAPRVPTNTGAATAVPLDQASPASPRAIATPASPEFVPLPGAGSLRTAGMEPAPEISVMVAEAVRSARARPRAAPTGEPAVRATPAFPGSQPASAAAPSAANPAAVAQTALAHAPSSQSSGPTLIEALESAPKFENPGGARVVTPYPALQQTSQAAVGSHEISARREPPAPLLAEQVALKLRVAVGHGVDRISIQLKPAVLGRVDVTLEIQSDGRVSAVVTAERSDTFELLRRDAHMLERALQEAGLRPEPGSLSFNLRGDGRHAPGNGNGPTDTPSSDATANADDPDASASAPQAYGGASNHTVDIEV